MLVIDSAFWARAKLKFAHTLALGGPRMHAWTFHCSRAILKIVECHPSFIIAGSNVNFVHHSSVWMRCMGFYLFRRCNKLLIHAVHVVHMHDSIVWWQTCQGTKSNRRKYAFLPMSADGEECRVEMRPACYVLDSVSFGWPLARSSIEHRRESPGFIHHKQWREITIHRSLIQRSASA